MKTATMTIHVPSTAAGTDDQWYAAIPYKGKWLVESVKIAPATALAIAATNFTTVTLTSNDGAGGADSAAIASYTSNTGGTALVLKTTVSPTVTQPATVIQEGHQFKLAKADSGSGQLHDATWTIGLRKVG